MVIDLLRVAHVKLVPRTHHATNAVKLGFSCEMVAKTFAEAASSSKTMKQGSPVVCCKTRVVVVAKQQFQWPAHKVTKASFSPTTTETGTACAGAGRTILRPTGSS